MYPNLDAELARKKITRTQLAKILDVNPGTLSLKLNGKAPLTLTECIEIKNAVGNQYSIEYLFSTAN
jgi:putative plasmid maintenance system antidote protein, XRE family